MGANPGYLFEAVWSPPFQTSRRARPWLETLPFFDPVRCMLQSEEDMKKKEELELIVERAQVRLLPPVFQP